LEVIVVDDNPAESEYRQMAEKIMQKFADDERVLYIQNEKNLGGAGARNVGIEASKGEYIAFLDDDDEYYPEKIEKQLNVFLHSDFQKLAMVYCDVEHVGKSGQVDCVIRKRHRGNCLYEAIADDCIAPTSQWLVKKEALLAVGSFSLVPCKQDSTVILKLLRAGYEVDYVPEILSKYQNIAEGVRISLSPKKIEGEMLFYEACKQCYDSFSQKQIDYIEYTFALRLYQLYSGRYGNHDEMMLQKRKMIKLRPFAAIAFFSKNQLRRWKKRLIGR